LMGMEAPFTEGTALFVDYRGTSRIRNSAPLGPYSRSMSRALWWSLGGWLFLMSEVPLCRWHAGRARLKRLERLSH